MSRYTEEGWGKLKLTQKRERQKLIKNNGRTAFLSVAKPYTFMLF